MKNIFIAAAALVMPLLLCAPRVYAAGQDEAPTTASPAPVSETPVMSEIPAMKEQVKRMTALMEQLSKESNPEIRRRIMAETMCPQ